MLNKNVSVYLINLDRSPDRLRNATANLNEVGLPFERISAVDGRNLDMENMADFAVVDVIKKERWITPQVIGCSLSHYQAYKDFLASGSEWALILEDDIEFSGEVVDIVNKSIDKINKEDIFLFYFHGPEKSFSKNGKININDCYAFYPAVTLLGGYSTGAYLIHREVARRLHDYVFPVHISADSYHVFQKNGAIGGLWALLPPISRSSNFGSDISYSRIGSFLRRFEELQIVPVTFFLRWIRRMMKTTATKYKIVNEAPEWLSRR